MVFKEQNAGEMTDAHGAGRIPFCDHKMLKAASYLLTLLSAQDFTNSKHNWHQAILPVIKTQKYRATYDYFRAHSEWGFIFEFCG